MDVRNPRYLILTGAGAVAFFTLAFSTPRLSPSILSTAHANTVLGILGSICASFVFLFVLDSAYHLLSTFYRKRFRRFFGDLSDTKQGATFVYPDFVLSETASSTLKGAGIAEVYAKRDKHYAGTRFIDIPHIVASNDLLSIVIMASRLGGLLGDSPRLRADGWAVENHERSLISFGLTSNAVTDLCLSADPDQAFRIDDPAGDPKIVVLHDATETRFGRDERTQHAVVLRYRPEPDAHPSRYWFICAGLAAAGTPAASWALSHNWLKYNKRFGTRDFLIILKTSNDIVPYLNPTEAAAFVRDKKGGEFVSCG
jgi:hypothetical protein